MIKRRGQRGFSLTEVLITVALVTVLSVVALNVLVPWLTFKQVLDTDRKLQDMRQALQTAYEAHALDVEADAGARFLGLTSSPSGDGVQCGSQAAALTQINGQPQSLLAPFMVDSGLQASSDGFANPLCFFISQRLAKNVEGVTLYYHVVAIVSMGQSGSLDANTHMEPATGLLTLAGDDKGVVVSGYSTQYTKYRDTVDRMNRVASLYESYFTTRFLNSADRDVSRDYFYFNAEGGDAGGSISSTNGVWSSSFGMLSSLGVTPGDGTSAFDGDIELGNFNESVVVRGGVSVVRSAASLATGATPPYTALLRARLPGDADNYVVRAVVGNY